MIILGVRIDKISSIKEILDSVVEWIHEGRQCQIVSVNPEGILLAQKDVRYRESLNRAALALTDGFGIQLAARIFAQPIPFRVTGVDLMVRLNEIAAQNNWKVYLVGEVGETARMVAERLIIKYPGLKIEGEEGIPIESQNYGVPSEHFDHLIIRINQFQPQLLFVALGQPKQELWISEHLKEMPSVRVAMGVGGAFNFLSGKVPRAPLIQRRIGLEWLWRLVVQPWRLPRIFNATGKFTWLVVKERFKR